MADERTLGIYQDKDGHTFQMTEADALEAGYSKAGGDPTPVPSSAADQKTDEEAEEKARAAAAEEKARAAADEEAEEKARGQAANKARTPAENK